MRAIRRLPTEPTLNLHPSRVRRVVISPQALRRQGSLPPRKQERRLANEYRVIKRPLIATAAGRGAEPVAHANLIMVTSALSGEGKTFNCLNLALSIAQEQDWRIVLVDGDVVDPSLSRLLGVEHEAGLMDLLVEPQRPLASCLLPTSVDSLSLLPAGQFHEQAAEYLSSERMARVVHDLAASDPNRIILFDSPPLLLTTEAAALAGHMGQIVMVVKAGHTSQQRVDQALAVLDPEAAISLVLNQVPPTRSSLAYGRYGYGSGGYGYGSGGRGRP